MAYQERLVRFIENHDEPRAAAVFSPERLRMAAVAAFTLPGAKLVHEGQLEGRCVRLPVFLGRRPFETPDDEVKQFYLRLLKAVNDEVFKSGEWRLCECRGWPDNLSYRNLLAWCWRLDADFRIVVVNYCDSRSQGLVRLPMNDLHDKSVLLEDAFSDACHSRSGAEMFQVGLFVNLPAWGYHFFKVHDATGTAMDR
jgi:hypothetical protein